MNILVFDTETVNLEKPFAYNIGYVVYNTDSAEILVKRDYVVEQVWHNPMLFVTAYYADKRDLYIGRMRSRKCIMDKFGYITQAMYRDIKEPEAGGKNIFLGKVRKTEKSTKMELKKNIR